MLNRWWHRIPWFIALGSATLFASAIAQVYFASSWSQERERLEFVQLKLSAEEAMATQLRIALRAELRRDPRDIEALVETANLYAQHSTVVSNLAFIRARGSEAATEDLYTSQVLITQSIHDAAARADLPALMRHIEQLEIYNSEHAQPLMKEATERYVAVVSMEDAWSLRFLGLYVVGSILLAVGAVRGWLSNAAK